MNSQNTDQFITWVTVSSKGQIVVPKEVRKNLHIKAGDRLLVILRKNMDGMNLIKSQVLDAVFDEYKS